MVRVLGNRHLHAAATTAIARTRLDVSSYKLYQLAPGSYDVALNGVIIAGLVRNETPSRHAATWTAELLIDLPPEERPAPFTEQEHQFGSLEEARSWLGDPVIQGEEQ
jgi:hypothetical protein